MKELYLIRHSAPFVKIKDRGRIPFSEFSKNMILSVEGEKNASKLCNIQELSGVDAVYSSNSSRSIETAKYVAENNNLELIVDNRLNEREFGITYIDELPKNFNYNQFRDENYKLENGESLKEVNERIYNLLNEVTGERIVFCIHGVMLMSYLQTICDVCFKDDKFKVSFNGKEIMNGIMSNPDVFKIVFDNDRVIDIQRINVI